MDEFLPYITNDDSVGLYSKEADDIYHSATGALTEAFEKFINPLELKDNIQVLDICFGIGYNTKSLLNEFIKKGYTHINIDCVDTNQFLMKISPFINSKVSKLDKVLHKKELYQNVESYKEAKKIVEHRQNSKNSKYELLKIVNWILYENIKKSLDPETEKFLYEDKNKLFFDKSMLKIHKFDIKKRYNYINKQNKSTYLHNIYYNYISKRNEYNEYDEYKKRRLIDKLKKTDLKSLKKYSENFSIDKINNFNNITLKFYAEDIREFIKRSYNKYDVILLDGFTPKKCPCIWSQDFFEELYSHMKDDAQLVTYNTSAIIRAAMLNACFKVGNIFDDNKNIIGTFATKKSKLIKNPLTHKQMGLLGTKAGIPYRDKNLNLSNEQILLNREEEYKNSKLESSSHYLKRCTNEI